MTAPVEPVVREQRRIEAVLAGLRMGESAVVNGTVCTIVDLATADRLDRERMAALAAAPRRRVLERFPAGAPRGSWPAEEFAAARRREDIPAEVVMDLAADAFLVVVEVAP